MRGSAEYEKVLNSLQQLALTNGYNLTYSLTPKTDLGTSSESPKPNKKEQPARSDQEDTAHSDQDDQTTHSDQVPVSPRFSHDEVPPSYRVARLELLQPLSSPPHSPPTPRRSRNRKPWYVITVGLDVGVFNDWGIAAAFCQGVPGAVHKKYPTQAEAHNAFNEALAAGSVCVVQM